MGRVLYPSGVALSIASVRSPCLAAAALTAAGSSCVMSGPCCGGGAFSMILVIFAVRAVPFGDYFALSLSLSLYDVPPLSRTVLPRTASTAIPPVPSESLASNERASGRFFSCALQPGPTSPACKMCVTLASASAWQRRGAR